MGGDVDSREGRGKEKRKRRRRATHTTHGLRRPVPPKKDPISLAPISWHRN